MNQIYRKTFVIDRIVSVPVHFPLILDTNFVHEEIEVPMNIAADNDTVAFWKIIYIVMRVGTHFRKTILKRSRSRSASKPLSPAFLKKFGLGSSPIL